MTDAELIAVLEDRLARAISSRNHTQQWYAERFERLKDLLKTNGLWDQGAAIIANGNLMHEPPTYAQQLNVMRHRAEAGEEAMVALCNLYNACMAHGHMTDPASVEMIKARTVLRNSSRI